MIFCILGQTASGKTSLAIELARKFDLPIISIDAYQCYKMMQIGTDKPRREEVEGLRYHFYDEYDPDFRMDVSIFKKEMKEVLDKYVDEGQDVLIVGGTFLYLKALLYDYPMDREEIRIDDDTPVETMREQLKNLSPSTYSMIDIDNPRRVKRALEQVLSGFERKDIIEKTNKEPVYPVRYFKIDVDKDEGNRLIDKRVDRMFEEGFLDEVKKLLAVYPENLNSFNSLGYREAISYLKGEITLDECKELIKVHTHQFAKRQRTFLRNQFDIKGQNREDIARDISSYIELKKRTDILIPNLRKTIEKKKVYLAGIGGVGGMCLESLVRTGFMEITIQDFDKVSFTNMNRQILFTLKDIGSDKTDVAKERGLSINPLVEIKTRKEKITKEEDIPEDKFDIIIDCIDDIEGKTLLYKKAKKDESLYLTSGGFGFHLDSTKIRTTTLDKCTDKLSLNFKNRLLQEGLDVTSIIAISASDGRRKAKKDAKEVGSIASEVNAAGCAIVSTLLIKLEEMEHGGKKD